MAAILGEAVRNSILKTMKLQGLCCIPGYWSPKEIVLDVVKKRKLFPLFAAKHEIRWEIWKNFRLSLAGEHLRASVLQSWKWTKLLTRGTRCGMMERRQIVRLWQRSGAAVLVTLVRAEGSSYRRPGARLLLTAGGDYAGTISGGWPILADVAITTRKGSGLAAPLTLLLNDLIQSGKYTQVLDRWSLGSEAIDKARTNPPGLPKS